MVTRYLDIEDNKKGYCQDGKIYISDWAMEQDKSVLMEIVIHELTHLFYPEFSENEVIDFTKKQYEKVIKKSEWICPFLLGN